MATRFEKYSINLLGTSQRKNLMAVFISSLMTFMLIYSVSKSILMRDSHAYLKCMQICKKLIISKLHKCVLLIIQGTEAKAETYGGTILLIYLLFCQSYPENFSIDYSVLVIC